MARYNGVLDGWGASRLQEDLAPVMLSYSTEIRAVKVWYTYSTCTSGGYPTRNDENGSGKQALEVQ
jgi:hypothetical protein